MSLSPPVLGLLCAVAFFAGIVDAIAGGGGLLTVPALLAAGLPPQLALGTNKGQSVFGSLSAVFRYARAGLVDRKQAAWTFPAAFAGSLGGAALLLRLDPAVLRPLVLVLLLLAGGVLAIRRPQAGTPPPRFVGPRGRAVAVAIAFTLGGYDGFFGPGTGTFLLLAFVGLLGATLPRATADAKGVYFASNLAAVVLFGSRGLILFSIALPMAAAQFLGGYVGAQLAIRGGAERIRRVVIGVVAALVIKLGIDLLRSL